MFTIEMLPAAYGDCLWVEYGDRAAPRRILIDGGISSGYDAIVERAGQAGTRCVFELVVVSHVDSDHIDGVVKLLANLPPEIEIKEIWFNGWDQLPAAPHSRLVRVVLDAGRLRAIVPEAMQFCFEVVSEGTRAEGAELVIREVPVRLRCEPCDLEWEPGEVGFLCARCGGVGSDGERGDPWAASGARRCGTRARPAPRSSSSSARPAT